MTSAEDSTRLAAELGLAADELSKPCDSNIIYSLASYFRDWLVIFASLLSEIDLDDIRHDNSTQNEKRVAALRKWKVRNGGAATYKVLVDALLNKGYRYDAESLCRYLADYSLLSNKNGKYQ